jgi:hypothetical protein
MHERFSRPKSAGSSWFKAKGVPLVLAVPGGGVRN